MFEELKNVVVVEVIIVINKIKERCRLAIKGSLSIYKAI